jgi:hypothetical protein
VVVGSPILNTRCLLDQSPVTRGSTEEKYRSDPLDLSVEDQQSVGSSITVKRIMAESHPPTPRNVKS